MSRKLLVGRAGSGKTHRCLERLVSVLPKRCLMLVPTYSQAEHLRFALLDRTKGLGQRVIHTFSSLAEHFGGCRLGDLLPEARRDRIAEGVLAGPFGDAAGQAGFRAEFLAAVKELKEQGRPLADAAAHARSQFPEGHRARNLFDAAVEYSAQLADIGKDHEDLLLTTRTVFRTDAPELDLLLVDGFHDFTPVQKEIVDLLAGSAAETIVSLPDGFETAKRTAAAFHGFSTERLTTNRRSRGALVTLEAGLFGNEAGFFGNEAGHFGNEALGDGREVSLLAAASEEDEADRLARHVARSGRPAHDFLLVRRGFDGRHALYRAAFERYGVAIRFFGSEPIATGPLARALEIFLQTRFRSVSASDMLPLLRSPYFESGSVDPDGKPDEKPDEYADEYAAALRQRLPVEEVCPADDRPLAVQLAERFNLNRALAQNPDGDADIARASRLLVAVRQEAESLRGVPVAEAARIVLRRLPQLRATVPDRRHDCVYAVEAKEARQWEKPVVLVAGLDAGSFPRPVRQDLFLRDDERRELADRGFSLPLRERREDDERYLFYVCLSRASESMVLSRVAYDESGNEIAKSPFLEDVERILPAADKRSVSLAEQFVAGEDAVRPADLLPIVADGLSRIDRGGSELAIGLHAAGVIERSVLAWPRRLELIRLQPLKNLPLDPVKTLSASRIKSFRRCPFLLLQKLLRAERSRDEELDAAVRGTIVHDTLEQLFEGGEVDEVFDRVFDKNAGSLPLGLEGRGWRRRMRRWVHAAAEDLRASDVLCVEEEFKTTESSVVLRGRIDRIDRLGGGELLRDYKTGTTLGVDDDPQLDVYLLARPDAVGAVFDLVRDGRQRGYVRDDVEGTFARGVARVSAAELEQRRVDIRALIATIASEARDGMLNVRPSNPENCTRGQCDGYDLCRVQKTRWLARVARESE